jgi:hypothetical protein
MLLDEAFRAKLVALPAVPGDSSLVCGYCCCSYRRYTYLSSRGVLFLFLETVAADEVQQRKKAEKNGPLYRESKFQTRNSRRFEFLI